LIAWTVLLCCRLEQGVPTNYDTDALSALMRAVIELAHARNAIETRPLELAGLAWRRDLGEDRTPLVTAVKVHSLWRPNAIQQFDGRQRVS